MSNCHIFKQTAQGISLFVLRCFIAYEFFEAGLEKWNGENWFHAVQDNFPFPFSILPADLNWAIATGAELIFPILLVLGLATRFSALGLMVLTAVAWATVHSGLGYNVCNNGYKLPLIYLITLLPLLLQSAGVISLDFLLRKKYPAKKWLNLL
ncbi:hypothetical protein B0186_00740 [Canicola haemoglobinophilus]|uniref:DoxX family protein n=1 Tax=Canicola haemoglobinophilus TaxID=733 RepID=A0A1V4B3H0_9PAST|nr:DoxX family protein [Canicola haemoglobinophilus]OOS01920.1 hypothetical protein B0186_00740 [Canicola haemoglobinophilus]STO54201.1 DoxX family protein [Canicola haemoglobinophilus]STO60369.1 DoxX family protein [Canicola haemoglobinophilus]STO68734.1 DoxX family protein [Canicola haemoglobinophilus]